MSDKHIEEASARPAGTEHGREAGALCASSCLVAAEDSQQTHQLGGTPKDRRVFNEKKHPKSKDRPE